MLGCGYVCSKKDGTERLNFTAFDEALLEAKGLSFGEAGKGRGKGNLIVGKAYTAMVELQSGDEFEIKLGRKQIQLISLGSSDEEED